MVEVLAGRNDPHRCPVRASAPGAVRASAGRRVLPSSPRRYGRTLRGCSPDRPPHGLSNGPVMLDRHALVRLDQGRSPGDTTLRVRRLAPELTVPGSQLGIS
jgi:hypothetical protein